MARAKAPPDGYRPTTQQEFNRFRTEFVKQVERLNLGRYTTTFSRDPLEDAIATIGIHHGGMVAHVTVNKFVPTESSDDWPERVARHEVTHMLLNNLVLMAKSRYGVSESELDRECEAVCNAMETVL